MGNITSQVILHLSVNGPEDKDIETGCLRLQRKAELGKRVTSELVRLSCIPELPFPFSPKAVEKLVEKFKHLGTESRVYMAAHGDWKSQTLAGASAEQCAELLKRANMPTIKLISILGCNSARDVGSSNKERMQLSMNSFAGNLLLLLGVCHDIRTTIYARNYLIKIRADGSKITKTEREYQRESEILAHLMRFSGIRKNGVNGEVTNQEIKQFNEILSKQKQIVGVGENGNEVTITREQINQLNEKFNVRKRKNSKWKFFWEGNRPKRAEVYSGEVWGGDHDFDEFE